MPRWAVILVGTTLGSLLASFLRLIWDRRWAQDGWVDPPSHCLACGAALRGVEIIPVFGWLWLGGKCRQCQASIGISHLVGEISGALIGFASGVLMT